MTNPNPTDPRYLAQREQEHTQERAAAVLVQLIAEAAPAAEWIVTDDGRRLDGQIMRGDDRDRRRGLAAWQRIIGAGPVDVHRHEGREHLRIQGSYEGVPVKVATIVYDPADEVAGLGEAA